METHPPARKRYCVLSPKQVGEETFRTDCPRSWVMRGETATSFQERRDRIFPGLFMSSYKPEE